jgi:HTH-type transcriptional regulator/antitoxin HigA
MDLTPLRSDADHAAALRQIETLWGAAEGGPDSDQLDVLADLVEAYEDVRWPVENVDMIGPPMPSLPTR